MSHMSRYEPFDIRWEKSPAFGYRLQIQSAAGHLTIPLTDAQLQRLETLAQATTHLRESGGPSREARVVSVSSHDLKTPKEIGGELYDLLFQGEAERLFDSHLKKLVNKAHIGLSVCLRFDLEDRLQAALARLPWELLYRPERHQFLAQSVETPVLRFVEMPSKVPKFALPPVLKILLVVAEPEDLRPLNGLSVEVEDILTSWEQDNVQVDVLRYEEEVEEDLGPRLRETLRNGEYHILHFMGHGTFDESTQEGSLFLETARKKAVQISGEHFAHWLINHRSLRLVVLNACSTGRMQDDQPFAGVASALVKSGVPSVLAMQAPMLDQLAAEFGRILYQELAEGSPVESALSSARVELYARAPDQPNIWATPVLLTQTPRIIEVPPKIGPLLTSAWTLLGSLHLLWVGLMFLRNRSLLPGIDALMTSSVAAFLGVFFGLPIVYGSLYCAIEFAKLTKLERADTSLLRRMTLRLPVAFHARIQGRALNETVYQFAFLMLLVVIPIVLQGILWVRTAESQVWLQREVELHSDSLSEALFKYVPPAQSILNDNYRLGSMDTRPGIERVINNVTYFPFWGTWGLLLAELLAIAMTLRLLWLLAAPHRKVP